MSPKPPVQYVYYALLQGKDKGWTNETKAHVRISNDKILYKKNTDGKKTLSNSQFDF